ncbi:hypothetical protein ACPF8X_05870 [Streptomyces sp. G35A]
MSQRLGVPRLASVGLEWQRSLSSDPRRRLGRDAERVARHLAVHPARR